MRWSYKLIEGSSERANSTRRENPPCRVKGNLRFPLTVTYHGHSIGRTIPELREVCRKPIAAPTCFVDAAVLSLVTDPAGLALAVPAILAIERQQEGMLGPVQGSCGRDLSLIVDALGILNHPARVRWD
jgi:hypothetical protein